MTERIPHRELRNDSSQILRQVKAGQTVEVTNHGEVVAVLVPPTQAEPAPLPIRRRRVTYDGRLSAAAQSVGLTVLSPR